MQQTYPGIQRVPQELSLSKVFGNLQRSQVLDGPMPEGGTRSQQSQKLRGEDEQGKNSKRIMMNKN